jgi:hypothetical protein
MIAALRFPRSTIKPQALRHAPVTPSRPRIAPLKEKYHRTSTTYPPLPETRTILTPSLLQLLRPLMVEILHDNLDCSFGQPSTRIFRLALLYTS